MNRAIAESGSPQQSGAALPVRRPRVLWIDLFRGLAVLVMIETHVVNTFLAGSVRAEGWFSILNYLNGLVAPSFLFISGFVQGMERGLTPDKPVNFARRARQLLNLLLIGYALHFPWTELGQHRWEEALRVGSQVDVLQCIAGSLGLLLGVSWLAQKIGGGRQQEVWWTGLVALLGLSVFIAPYAAECHGLPVPLQGWINRSTGSWFPLFSWAGFVFFGALAGAVYGLMRRATEAPDNAPNVSPVFAFRRASSVFLFTPLPLAASAWAFRTATYSVVSPASFFERAAWVLVLAAVCEWFVNRQRPALPLFAGKHSLALYVIHLVLISTIAGCGLPMNAIPLPNVLGGILVIGAASVGLTWLLDRARTFLRERR